ncbi:hypothetical protein DICVIV_06233 [Dictyocaulus viviparus]|uniref:Uncharacterized protein n=1 Tax=Dictyocaulus viviparus TaxID=29172 RepID=A0A0D8XZ87_DICVI|nr:hypothetical protein DICVIV_06233 [Dictyocaulus viviparus]
MEREEIWIEFVGESLSTDNNRKYYRYETKTIHFLTVMADDIPDSLESINLKMNATTDELTLALRHFSLNHSQVDVHHLLADHCFGSSGALQE